MSREAQAGGVLFTQSGCLTCHTYRGTGERNLGAHDLTTQGREGMGVERLARYIANPPAFGNAVMPRFGRAFTPAQLHELAAFLNESR
jgi:mono/diheme cytochrome c family protein